MQNHFLITLAVSLLVSLSVVGQTNSTNGHLTIKKVARNAVRIQYQDKTVKDTLPDWLYVRHDEVAKCDVKVEKDDKNHTITIKDRKGNTLFHATRHKLLGGGATLAFDSPKDECLFGLGQFQDGYSNVRGLSRRLTQVNTQISIPMLISSKGYGILWNNYGLTEFNPCGHQVVLNKNNSTGSQEVVNVTSTEGNKQEIINMQNVWLPPTTSVIVQLAKGRHHLTAELSKGDQPVLYYNKVENTTVFHSPIATAVDYTVFIGSPDEIIATYRDLTGRAPQMPTWALGYIHCRERFHSSAEILQTARRFRDDGLPISMIVQDWQYWGIP